MQLRAVSLFSGAGGLDVGFEAAGFMTVFANEFDHDAAEAWRINRPTFDHVMVEGDIHDHMDELSDLADVDVLFGGPPCQGFSVAGKMNPDDERSQLVWRFMDAVKLVRPKVFVMENVAALGRLKKWQGVREGIVSRGASLGYDVSFKVHHTPDYGVPENRDRIIFVGVRRDVGDATRFYQEMGTRRADPVTARDAILSAGEYGTEDNPQTCTSRVTLAANPVMRRSPYAGMLVNGAGRPIDLNGIAPTLPASMGGNKTPIVDEDALRDPSRRNWFEVYHEGLVNGTMSPLTATVPPTVRRLTIRECAAIQTFPDGYAFSGRKTKQYRQIGNAVPCRFAEAVAASVRDAYLAGDGFDVVVPSADGLATVTVHVRPEDDGYRWGYDFGADCEPICDGGFSKTYDGVAEAIAQSLCAVGFDTTTDDVLDGLTNGNRY